MARNGVGRRLLAALAGSTRAFTATEPISNSRGIGRRLLAALAGSTPAFRSAEDSDEYTSLAEAEAARIRDARLEAEQMMEELRTEVQRVAAAQVVAAVQDRLEAQLAEALEAQAEDMSPERSRTEPSDAHFTIVVVDVEGFGDQRRTSSNLVAVRAGLHQVLRQAFEQAGISWADCYLEDRGDGVLILAPAEIPKRWFADRVPQILVTVLRRYNTTHPDAVRIRLRMALHADEVTYDQHGVSAPGVNLAFRLLDAAALKIALAESPGVLAVITSGWFFGEVVRHIRAHPAVAYRPVLVTVKDSSRVAWISLPDHPYPSAPAHLTGLPVAVTAEVEETSSSLARSRSRDAIGGSWFRRFWQRSRVRSGAGPMREHLAKLERALELEHLGKRLAETDKVKADAVASLLREMRAMEQENAVIRAGSLILIKTQDALFVRSLSEMEAAALDKNSDLLSDPVAALKLLSDAKDTQESTSVDPPS